MVTIPCLEGSIPSQSGGILESFGQTFAFYNYYGGTPNQVEESIGWMFPLQKENGSEIRKRTGVQYKNVYLFTHVGNNDYQIRDYSSGLILKVKDNNYVSDQPVVLYHDLFCHNYIYSNQLFNISFKQITQATYWKITHKESGLVVRASSTLELGVSNPAGDDPTIMWNLVNVSV